MRDYPYWACTCCGHKVARDLIDPTAPPRCRGDDDCPGWYRKSAYYFDEPDWENGVEARDREMRQSSVIVASCIRRANAERKRKREAARA